jgi:hypothetical protein
VPGCKTYRVVPTEAFVDSYRLLRDGYYSRLGEADNRLLTDTVAAFLATLGVNPRPGQSSPEPWPGRQPKTSSEGFDCRKIRFYLPGLRGSARMGRIVYLVHEASCTIDVVWIYNHEQFDRRPSDAELKRAFRHAIAEARAFLEREAIRVEMPDGSEAEIRIDIRPRSPSR